MNFKTKNPLLALAGFLSASVFLSCVANSAPASGDITLKGGLSAQLIATSASGQTTGTFNILSYNVAGLPAILSSSDPTKNTAYISCLIRGYDVVQVQEDFNYHATLYDSCDNHLYRSPTSGGVPFGSGLNQLSNFPYSDFERITWTNRVGPDALTPKGFTMARTWLAPGVAIDFYNLHAQAGQTDPFSTASWDEAALAASRSDINQLMAYINANSQGNAVVIFGDTNTRYTRAGQNMQDFLAAGFRDVWIDLVRDGELEDASEDGARIRRGRRRCAVDGRGSVAVTAPVDPRDGAPIGSSVDIPIAVDPWVANSEPSATGGCVLTIARDGRETELGAAAALAALGAIALRKRRRA